MEIIIRAISDPRHLIFQGMSEEARVLVPRQAFLSGRLDLNRLLSSAPPELIAHLQRTIAQQARVFQFSEVDDEGDQLHALLVGADGLEVAATRVDLPSTLLFLPLSLCSSFSASLEGQEAG